MVFSSWQDVAMTLASYAQREFASVSRGALVFQCADNGPLAAAVFGNDDYASSRKTKFEVDLIRHWLNSASIEELAFGLSADGGTWTLLAQTSSSSYHTDAGRRFQIEMLKELLGDAVEQAWKVACLLSHN